MRQINELDITLASMFVVGFVWLDIGLNKLGLSGVSALVNNFSIFVVFMGGLLIGFCVCLVMFFYNKNLLINISDDN